VGVAIETQDLTKVYERPSGWRRIAGVKAVTAVSNITLTIPRGELFGLLGSNGAGKTTLVKMLCTLILPSRGQATVAGQSLNAAGNIRAAVGLVVSDERSFYWRLSGRSNLDFFAALYGLQGQAARERIEIVLRQVNLHDVADRRFSDYSSGMRQRLAIARSLLHQPEILFLDEPTRSLDPNASQSLHNLLLQLRREQEITIFLVTHDLMEAEKLCDRVALLHNGRLQTIGRPLDLRRALRPLHRYSLQVGSFPPDLWPQLQQIEPGIEVDHGRLHFSASEEDGVLTAVLAHLHQHNIPIQAIEAAAPSLEEVFTHFTREGSGPMTEERRGRGEERGAKGEGGEGRGERGGGKSEGRRAEGGLYPLSLLRAFLRRDFYTEISYRLSFLMGIGGIFLRALLFYFLALFIGDAAAPLLRDYNGDYFAFVLIGIAFGSYFGLGLTGFANALRQAQTTGTLEAMMMTPTPVSLLVVGSAVWSYTYTTFRVLVYLLIGTLLGVNFSQANYGGALMGLVLSIIAFASVGIFTASVIMVIKRGDPITAVFGNLASIIGGVFYPVEILPDWLQMIANLLPITYALRAMRLSLLSGAGWPELAPNLLALSLFCLILFPLSLLAFRASVNRARLDGSLTHY
jgi:ABC-type multidrug transport system ATPase subunit/ABC-type polysaccharide/polyol phosphate export permease